MKLKTKLIPLVSVAAVCATVAPISLTSCGNNGFVDLTKIYIPKIERTVGPISDATDSGQIARDCEDFYFEKVKNDPSIFAQDFYFGHSLYFQMAGQDFGFIPVNVKAKVYDIVVERSDILYSDFYPWLMSYTADFTFTLDFPSGYIGYEDTKCITTEGTFKITKIPYHLAWMTPDDEVYTYGWTPKFLFGYDWFDTDYDNTWSLEQKTTTTWTRQYKATDLQYTIIENVDIKATTSQDMINLILEQNETILGIVETACSYYMTKIGGDGK